MGSEWLLLDHFTEHNSFKPGTTANDLVKACQEILDYEISPRDMSRLMTVLAVLAGPKYLCHEAMFILGSLYHFGRGVEVDTGTARKWYKMAWEHGNPKAGNNLGAICVTSSDDDVCQEGIKILRETFAKGFKDSIYNLGLAAVVRPRLFTREEFNEIMNNLRDVSKEGHPFGCNLMGIVCASATSRDRDRSRLSQAPVFFLRSFELGHNPGGINYALCMLRGYHADPRKTEPDYRAAFEILVGIAAGGNDHSSHAALILASCSHHNIGEERVPNWFNESLLGVLHRSEISDDDISVVGCCLRSGRYLPRDFLTPEALSKWEDGRSAFLF